MNQPANTINHFYISTFQLHKKLTAETESQMSYQLRMWEENIREMFEDDRLHYSQEACTTSPIAPNIAYKFLSDNFLAFIIEP